MTQLKRSIARELLILLSEPVPKIRGTVLVVFKNAISADVCERCSQDCEGFTDDAMMLLCAQSCRNRTDSCWEMANMA